MRPLNWLRAAQDRANRLGGALFQGLWVPRPIEAVNPAEKIMRSFVSWEDVYPQRPVPNLDDVGASISRIDRADLLQVLSRMNFIRHALYATEGSYPDSQLLSPFYSREALTKLIELERTRGGLPLSRAMITMLQSVCLSHCSVSGGIPALQEPTIIGDALLACGSHCEGTGALSDPGRKLNEDQIRDLVFGTMYRNYEFNIVDRVAWTLTRYWVMLAECQLGIPRNDSYDLNSAVEKACGVSWQAHLAYGFTCLGFYTVENPKKFLSENPQNFLFNESIFRNTKAAPAASRFLMQVSKTIEALGAERMAAKPARIYDFNWLFVTPLVRLPGNVFYPLDLASLASRITSGVYWEVHQSLLRTPEFNRFKTYWGRVFEAYVGRLLKEFLPSTPGLGKRLWVEHADGFEGGVDFIVLDGENAAFIQVTTEHIPIHKTLSGDWATIKDSIRKLLIEREGKPGKAHKLGTAIARFRNGSLRIQGVNQRDIRRIFPIIVMEHGLAQIPGITGEIRNLVAKETEMGELANFLEFWDIEEVELAEDLFRKGITRFIAEKHASVHDEAPFKNFIHHSNLSAEGPYMQAAYHKVTRSITGTLFGTDAPN